MIRRALLAVLPFSALFAACATSHAGTPVAMAPPPVQQTAAEPGTAGEIVFSPTGGGALSASFDAWHVVGPQVNVARTSGDRWAGNVFGRTVSLDVAPGRLTGPGVDLRVDRKGQAVTVRGIWFTRRVQLTIEPGRVDGTADGGRCSVDLAKRGPGQLGGELGCNPRRRGVFSTMTVATLRLEGSATDLANPPLPQLALALLSVLPA